MQIKLVDKKEVSILYKKKKKFLIVIKTNSIFSNERKLLNNKTEFIPATITTIYYCLEEVRFFCTNSLLLYLLLVYSFGLLYFVFDLLDFWVRSCILCSK